MHFGVNPARGYNSVAQMLFPAVEFPQQLLLQMSARSLFDRTALSGYLLLLCQPFAPCSWLHRLGQVSDLRSALPDVSLPGFCVRIHRCSARCINKDNSHRAKREHEKRSATRNRMDTNSTE